MSTRVILDCDPGIDDALAIAFAIGHPGIEFTGITTVAGNVGLAKTTANALAVASFAGAPGVPVTAGCPTPLLRPPIDAGHVHGESGLGGAVPKPRVMAVAVAVGPVDGSSGGRLASPVPATRLALKRAGLAVADIDVIESNEAFAAQACAVAKDLGFDPAKTNPNGSGISLGHPVGATGTILAVKALYELERIGGRYALVTMCIGGGQGIAAVFERV